MRNEESSCLSGKVNPSLGGHKIDSGAMLAQRCKRGKTGPSLLVHLAEPYWSSIVENKSRASDSVIHPRSPTCKAPSDADNANTSTTLSLRASGGTEVPNAALIVFHIPMTEPLYWSAANQHSLDPQGLPGAVSNREIEQ
jgi:hypothetical protein